MYNYVSQIFSMYNYEQGCTKPLLVELDNHKRAVLKYPNNQMGIHVLLNEYTTYSIAKKINVKTPNFGIAVVNKNTKLDNIEDTNEKSYIKKNSTGVCFYSEYIDKTIPATPEILKFAENINEANKIILLDHIVKNCDRYSSGVLVRADKFDTNIYAIDHSHALGDPEWSVSSLSMNDTESPYVWQSNGDFYKILISSGAKVTLNELEVQCEFIQNSLKENIIDDIFNSIPDEWVLKIGKENVNHAKKYIKHRVYNLKRICRVIDNERG